MTLKRDEVNALALIHERPECKTCYGTGRFRYDDNAPVTICPNCDGAGKRALEIDEQDALILVLNETRAERDLLLGLLGKERTE